MSFQKRAAAAMFFEALGLALGVAAGPAAPGSSHPAFDPGETNDVGFEAVFSWENLWKSVENLWKTYGNLGKTYGNLWKTMGKLWKTMGKLWKIYGNLWKCLEMYGKP